MKRIVFLLPILLLLISCKSDMKLVKTDDFVIKVPKNAIDFKGQMLNEALLEYADTVRSIQIIVEKRSSSEFIPIDSARKAFVDYYLEEDAIDSTFHVINLHKKNGYIIKAETIDLNEDLTTSQTFWVVGFYQQTPMDYYIIWTWTKRLYKPDNEETMEKIVESFKLLKK